MNRFIQDSFIYYANITERQHNSSISRRILALIFSVLLSSCSPIKAYSGSELPSNMTSLFEVASFNPNGFTANIEINGTRIGSSGVVVKPGIVGIEGKLGQAIGKYRNCRCSMVLDNSAYAECKKQPYAYCSECLFTRGSEYCEEEHDEYLCRIEYAAVAGGEYEILVDFPFMYLNRFSKTQTKVVCQKSGNYWKDTLVSSYITGPIHIMKDGQMCQSGC